MYIKNYNKFYLFEDLNLLNNMDDTSYGQIIFSTDVNSIQLDNNRLFNFIKRKIATLLNRYKYKYILEDILKNNFNDYSGYTLSGKNTGVYKSFGNKIYKERSYILKIIDVDIKDLIKIAEQIAIKFKQESVLLIYITNNYVKKMFVKNPKV